ncbi:MAG: hypothetical protein OEM32_05470, partial [Acidimicrobiia bacterium]|nr:hypothetical protein [Acidimicrobiia bacterium]
SRSHTLRWPTASTRAIRSLGAELLARGLADEDGVVTMIGIAVSHLTTDQYVQLELGFDDGDVTRPGSRVADLSAALDREIDSIRDKYGNSALEIGAHRRGTSDEFRRLAERS